MIKKKELEKLPVLPVNGKGRDRFVGRIQIYEKTMVMDVYDCRGLMCPEEEEKPGEIRFRWACDKKTFCTFMFREKKWTRRGISHGIYGCTTWYSVPDIKLDEQSKRAAEEFLQDVKMGPWGCRKSTIGRIMGLEGLIRDEERNKREDQRKARIKARQEARGPLPKDWQKWLRNHVFEKERYVFYDAKRRKTGACAYCEETINLDGNQQHNGTGICPACGSKIRYKAVGKTPEMCIEKRAVYFQKIKSGFLVRYLKVCKTSTPKGESYTSEDTILTTYNGEKTWHDYCQVSEMTGAEYWSDMRPNKVLYREPEGILYTRNVRQVLKNTQFQYAPLAEWQRNEKREIPVDKFLCTFQNSSFLEYFVKAGLYRLTREYVSGYERWGGNTLSQVLGINKSQMKRLMGMNGGIIALGWLQYENEGKKYIPDSVILWMESNRLECQKCKEILEYIGSIERLINYLKKQAAEPRQAAGTWRDYLQMAQAEGMDITDDIVRFPKDLRRRHDQLVELRNARADEERFQKMQRKYRKLDAAIQSHISEAERYCWENMHYRITPAVECRELVAEGRALHHCVGNDSYMEKMAAGKSWILFLRRKEEPDKPYYTIEIDVKSDRVLQWYSEFDRQPDAEVIQKVLNAFQKSLKRKSVKPKLPAMAIA